MTRENEPAAEDAMQAAREVTDPDTLLPGEERAIRTDHLDDARVWLATYEELFAFKQRLLGTLLAQRDTVQAEGLHEVQNDEILLTREADRLARRLEFWQSEFARRSP